MLKGGCFCGWLRYETAATPFDETKKVGRKVIIMSRRHDYLGTPAGVFLCAADSLTRRKAKT